MYNTDMVRGFMMENIFFMSFAVGIIYAVVSFLLGNVISFGDIDADLSVDWDDIGFFDVPVSPLKPIVIASFVTVFGGVGLLTFRYYSLPLVLSMIIAFTAALMISFLIYRFIVVPLYRAQNGLVHDIQTLHGTHVVVISSIYGDHYGKIRYVVNEGVYSAPAKSIDATDIKQGEEAVIIKVEKNVFFVERIVEEANDPE